ncbi:hypothetical protein [Paenibacillus sp. 481]|uniref:hypothetical protein n=1 Tax=Paenibacillus sp. 481 TaxID=2835869 RepID=UPI001E2D890A|nr:hypothetical protein [Paenibacillus sp. 481]UHA75064.1 hypothetical protein KIK04_08600 [Paenibacillus sp. 481]
MSLPGDSGSVWLRNSDNFVAAVNFASTSNGLRSISYPFSWLAQIFDVDVAKPNVVSGTGRVKNKRKHSYAYVKPLTSKQLASIKVIAVRRKKKS